jgi:putative ABC transport system permease protein
MIRFLFKGLIRDRHRSLLPMIVTSIGVMLTVVFQSWMTGVLGGSIEYNARFSSGHVKAMTPAYQHNMNQMPNDLAIIGTGQVMDSLHALFPFMDWAERIHFAGLIDVPDEEGETVIQGNALGMGIDLLSPHTREAERLKLRQSLRSGNMPQKPGEALMSHDFSLRLGISPGEVFTLIGSTMYRELAVYNFTLSGTVEFGTTALDKGTIIADLQDIRSALNMNDAAGEILGFTSTGYFDQELTGHVIEEFNERFYKEEDQFSTRMISLRDQNNMGTFLDYSTSLIGMLLAMFITAMSIILWNAGLLGGLRRYGEFGMRLAIGEEKNHVYKSMIIESLIIGLSGSVIGVIFGMIIAAYLQKHGIDMGIMMKNASIMIPNVFHARITPQTWYIGFIPGVLSALIGTMLAGIGIYKRQTARLIKELQA